MVMKSNGEKSNSLKDEVQNTITQKKVLITFPKDVFENLSNYSKDNSADCYWLAIKQLLDFHKSQNELDLRMMMLLERGDQLKEEIAERRNELNALKSKPREPKVIKGFGGSKKIIDE